MLARFDSIERFDSNSGPAGQFGLRPTDAFAIADNVAG